MSHTPHVHVHFLYSNAMQLTCLALAAGCIKFRYHAVGRPAGNGGKTDESAGRYASLTAAYDPSVCSASGEPSHTVCYDDIASVERAVADCV